MTAARVKGGGELMRVFWTLTNSADEVKIIQKVSYVFTKYDLKDAFMKYFLNLSTFPQQQISFTENR